MKIINKIFNYYRRKGLLGFFKIFLVLGSKLGIVAQPPYEYIQGDIERNLANYLNKSNREIRYMQLSVRMGMKLTE